MLDMIDEALSGLDDILSLKRPLAADSPADEEDVLAVKKDLRRSGYYDGPDYGLTPYPDKPLFEGIRAYQKDNGLKIDGVMKPGGETETTLNRARIAQADPFEARARDEGIVRQFIRAKNEERTQRRPSDAALLPVPPRKPDVFSKKSSPTNIPQLDPDSTFDKFRERLRPREGGLANRSKEADPGGKTNKGMSWQALDQIRKSYPGWNLPKDPESLKEDEITALFRHEYYDRPQIQKLNDIAGYNITGSKLVEHVFDAGIMTDSVKPGRWLQQSIDETIGTDLRSSPSKKGRAYDGILGSKTRAALEEAVKQGKVKEISRKFWNKRMEYLKSLPNWSSNPGWQDRMEEFKE